MEQGPLNRVGLERQGIEGSIGKNNIISDLYKSHMETDYCRNTL